MMTNQLSSNKNAMTFVNALVLITCVGATNPSFATGFNFNDQIPSHRKRTANVPDITWDSSAFRISGQRFSHTRSGWNPDADDFGFDINVKAAPVEEFSIKANIVSVEDYKPRVFIEDIYFED